MPPCQFMSQLVPGVARMSLRVPSANVSELPAVPGKCLRGLRKVKVRAKVVGAKYRSLNQSVVKVNDSGGVSWEEASEVDRPTGSVPCNSALLLEPPTQPQAEP